MLSTSTLKENVFPGGRPHAKRTIYVIHKRTQGISLYLKKRITKWTTKYKEESL